MNKLMTTGDIARRLGLPQARLNYALDRSGIHERGRAGILRLFSEEQLPAIEAAVARIRERRGARVEAN